MTRFKHEYRVVRDDWCGYEAQFRLWWFPFVWLQCFGVNTRCTEEEAKAVALRHAARGVVKHLGRLP